MSFRSGLDRGAFDRGTVPYPDPYQDIAHFNIPPSYKSLMILCRRLFLTDSLVNPTIWKLSNYPLTDLRIEAATPSIRTDWEVLLKDVLKIKRFLQLMNLDFHVYGNAIVSIVFPFDKWLICPKCNLEQKAEHSHFKFNVTGLWDYTGKCPGCLRKVVFLVEDRHVRRGWNRLKLLRWPPLTIDIDHQPYGQFSTYYHRIPREVRATLQAGNRLYAATLPAEFIYAARIGKRIQITGENLYHMARPSISDVRVSMGPWGMPVIMPVVKDIYARQILLRSQEAMAQHRILPLRWLWPLMGNQASPIGGINLGNWRARMEEEVRKHIRDPNYTGISPIPIGMGTTGADARPILLNQELLASAEQIVVGMGVPKGWVFGDLNFSSASVTQRMIENELIASRTFLIEFIDGFLKPRLQTYLDWPTMSASFTSLRMADDIQKLNLLFQSVSTGMVSKRDFLREFSLDYDQQQEQRRLELEDELEIQKLMREAQAEAEGSAAVIMARFNHEAQMTVMDLQRQAAAAGYLDGGGMPGDPQLGMGDETEALAGEMGGESFNPMGGQPPSTGETLDAHAQEFAGMPGQEQQAQLQAMQTTNPVYAGEVRRRAGQLTDMKPLPEKLPPRREVGPI